LLDYDLIAHISAPYSPSKTGCSFYLVKFEFCCLKWMGRAVCALASHRTFNY